MPQRMLGLLLRPSVLSISFSLLLGIIILGTANWSNVLETFFFYDYFFGVDGIVTQLQPATSNGNIVDNFFESSLTFNAIIIGCAVLLGAVTFGALSLFSNLGNTTTARELNAPDGVSRGAMRMEFKRRFKVRLVVGTLWVIYTQMTLKLIIPFCILASQVGITSLWETAGILYLVFALGLFIAAVHVHVVFLRLFALKPRLFGSKEAMLTDRR